MKNQVTDCVYALYQTDKWHTYQSRVLFYIGTSVLDCANALRAAGIRYRSQPGSVAA